MSNESRNDGAALGLGSSAPEVTSVDRAIWCQCNYSVIVLIFTGGDIILIQHGLNLKFKYLLTQALRDCAVHVVPAVLCMQHAVAWYSGTKLAAGAPSSMVSSLVAAAS